MSKQAFLSLSYWAVGRHEQTSQVAIKLNDLPPILMSVDNAREVAAALNSEADAVTPSRPRAPDVPSRRAPAKK
jgi:hypothetical protein